MSTADRSKAGYMPIYDDVATYGSETTSSSPSSPVSTVLTDACTSSPTLSSNDRHCPVYENLEELTRLCTYSSSSTSSTSLPKSQKPSLNMDFLKSIPPPPLQEPKQPVYPYMGTSTSSSSASSTGTSSSTSSSQRRTPLRPLDMRPLSVPHREMARIQRANSHRTLIVILTMCTAFVIVIAFSIWYFFDEIDHHLSTISEIF
ncbi:unnamed protein product [Caenorhabditis auriculariae]|uniref:Uncharacterized protein n=1 Tax=Caenorhabditis auriculariae TaxID=2777116 RepID=A0A8S1GR03_9PELO|nr:unnamed protein product [Caenorhabditis auriculariae]